MLDVSKQIGKKQKGKAQERVIGLNQEEKRKQNHIEKLVLLPEAVAEMQAFLMGKFPGEFKPKIKL